MKSFALACKAFSNFAVALLLSACAGSSIPAGVASGGDVAPQAYKNTKRFHYRGKEQSFVVPSGVTKLTVVAYGARGGGTFQSNYSQLPGYGGRVSAVVPVKSGETLYVYVGGASVGIQGGFNGNRAPREHWASAEAAARVERAKAFSALAAAGAVAAVAVTTAVVVAAAAPALSMESFPETAVVVGVARRTSSLRSSITAANRTCARATDW